MRPLYGNTEEMDLGHVQKYQNLRDNIDSANNWAKLCNLLKLYCIARKKKGDIPLTGVG
jgi:hypothetical protein